MQWVWDAEQLSFQKLDDEEITWVTIRGNHVPIPKRGSKRQKAEAIKQWFASKKKDLPQKSGQHSVYSAKFEHEKPKVTGVKGTGEGPSVHTDGQYTLKNIAINKARYFEKWANPRWILAGDRLSIKKGLLPDPDTHWATSFSDVKIGKINEELIADSIKYSGYFNAEAYLKHVNKQLEKIDEKIETAQKNLDWELKKKEKKDFNYSDIHERDYRETLQGLKDKKQVLEYIKPILEAHPKLMEEQGYVAVPANYMVDGKPVFNERVRNNIQLYWAGVIGLEELKARADTKEQKTIVEKINSKEDIVPAKAQMSRVEIPAEKYFLDEDTFLFAQPKYIRQHLVDLIIKASYYYQNRFNGSKNELDEKFEMWKSGKGYDVVKKYTEEILLNSPHGVNQEKREEIRTNILKELVNYEPPLMGENEMLLQNPHLTDPHMEWGRKPMESNYDLEKRLKQENIGNIMETEYISDIIDTTKYSGKSFYDLFKTYVSVSGDRTRRAFLEAGIKGSTYWGGSDHRGHVVFSDKDMKVLERTTSREKIKEWIDKQNEIKGNIKRDAESK